MAGSDMRDWIAEALLALAFRVASKTTPRGDNLRRSVWDHFTRFRFAPAMDWNGPMHRIPFWQTIRRP